MSSMYSVCVLWLTATLLCIIKIYQAYSSIIFYKVVLWDGLTIIVFNRILYQISRCDSKLFNLTFWIFAYRILFHNEQVWFFFKFISLCDHFWQIYTFSEFRNDYITFYVQFPIYVKAMIRVDKANIVCRDQCIWKIVVSLCSDGNKAWSICTVWVLTDRI